LLSFIIEGNIHIRHPSGNWAVWLRAFLMEASSTANDHLFSAQDIIAESWWDVQVRFASWAIFKLRDAH